MTKELLEKLKNAKTNEEVKQIIEVNKSVLTDDDLDNVSGGRGYSVVIESTRIVVNEK